MAFGNTNAVPANRAGSDEIQAIHQEEAQAASKHHGFHLSKRKSKRQVAQSASIDGSMEADQVYNAEMQNQTRKEKKAAEIAKAEGDLRVANTDAREKSYAVWVSLLHKPASWCSEEVLNDFYEMGYSSSAVDQAMRSKFVKAVLFGTLLGCFGLPFLLRVLGTHVNGLSIMVVGSIMFVAMLWLHAQHQAKSAYNNYMYERQLAFTQFERLLIPYLSEMKNNVSLFSMLKRIIPRMEDPADKVLIQRLMSYMSSGESSNAPFIDFARRFGGSDSARLFMLSLYQMYLGNYSDKVVKDLGAQANRELMSQINYITKRKLHRFTMLSTWLTMCLAIVLVVFMGLLVVDQMQQAFSLM